MKSNIFILIIDAFRSDSCFSTSKNSKIPNIDSLIKKGISFTQAISSSPGTFLSSASILTGFFPFKAIMSDEKRRKLHSQSKTFISHLKENGYHSYAMVPELISLRGLAKDFDEIYAPNKLEIKDLILSTSLGKQILKKFDSHSMKEPWILYIHCLDLHEKDWLPKEYDLSKFGKNEYEKSLSVMDIWIGRILEKIDFEKTLIVLSADHGSYHSVFTPELEKLERKNRPKPHLTRKITGKLFHSRIYKTENFFFIFVRNQFGKFIRLWKHIIILKKQIKIMKIKRKKVPPYTKRLFLNAINPKDSVYDDHFRIPLIFAGYGISSQRIINQQVRSVDIFPTILDIIGLPKMKHKIHGRSLLPIIKGEDLPELPAHIESAANWMNTFTTNEIGIRTSKYKYFRSRNDPTKQIHFFNLEKDPKEENNIAKKYPKIVAEMEKILTNLRNESMPEHKEEEITKEEEHRIEEELKKLGYI